MSVFYEWKDFQPMRVLHYLMGACGGFMSLPMGHLQVTFLGCYSCGYKIM